MGSKAGIEICEHSLLCWPVRPPEARGPVSAEPDGEWKLVRRAFVAADVPHMRQCKSLAAFRGPDASHQLRLQRAAWDSAKRAGRDMFYPRHRARPRRAAS